MRLLLDTHIFLAIFHDRVSELPRSIGGVLTDPAADYHVSVASVWEVAIKVRLGKLRLGVELPEVPTLLRTLGFMLVTIEAKHALAEVDPLPATRDPFDRMLLAQCAVEGLRLVTTDRALAAHPLAWRPG